MASFAPILKTALKRTGGEAKLEAQLPVPKTPKQLAAVSDDRYLSQMCLRVFRAGLKHALVDSKWPAFEEVFHGFVPGRVTLMNDEEMEACMGNKALIRHWAKLTSVRANAAAMQSSAPNTAVSANGWRHGPPTTRWVCGIGSQRTSASWAEIRVPTSCAWWARTRSS